MTGFDSSSGFSVNTSEYLCNILDPECRLVF